jgi:hypothetical protein
MRRVPWTAPLIEQERNQPGPESETEPLSPELALVDPDLAHRARARLTPVDVGTPGATPPSRQDGQAPGEHDHGSASDRHWTHASVRERLLAAGADPERLLPFDDSADREQRATSAERRGRSHRRPWLIVATVTVAALTGAAATFVLLGARSDETTVPRLRTAEPMPAPTNGAPSSDEREPGRASRKDRSRRTPQPGPPSPAPTTKKRGDAARPATLATRAFVWPPASRAAFYRVEFFTRGRKVFEASPTKPRLTLPLRWTYRGRRFRLARGTYQWRVRPAFGRSPTRLGTQIIRSTWIVR